MNKVQLSRKKYSRKELKSAGYKRLFLCLVLNGTTPTRQLAYVMKTDFAHAIFLNYNLTIRDNGQINIGTIIRLYHVCPIKNIMPDNRP